MPNERALVLFTKPPRPGRVKTRLIGPSPAGLSAEEAAELHWAFVLDQLERFGGRDFDLWIAWALEDGESPPEVEVPSFRQRGADLGERLWNGLSRLAPTAKWIAVVGSDHPGLTLERVGEAFDLLGKGVDVVLGPAIDGGYYLLALASDRLDRRLFEDIAWSTGSVLEQTLTRCRELGLEIGRLEAARDVDTPDDLARLAVHLADGGGGCPRTERLLASWGRLRR